MMSVEGIITTVHQDPGRIAGSLSPDNLASMKTTAGAGVVITRISGENLRSIIASVDDYLMNLAIGEDICTCTSR